MRKQVTVPEEIILGKIYEIRGEKVMVDRDLAELYGVTTENFNKAVSRNIKRFPEDFMFQLTKEEYDSLRFQYGSLKRGAHSKYLSNVFSERGVAMLSGILSSDRAVKVNIQIMRAYSKMREMLLTHKDLLLKMEHLEKKVAGQDEKVMIIFEISNSSSKNNKLEERR